MSDDLVKRLRDPEFGTETTERNLMNSAADRIEELEAERDALVEAMKAVASYTVPPSPTWRTKHPELFSAMTSQRDKCGALFSLAAFFQNHLRATLAELKGQDDE